MAHTPGPWSITDEAPIRIVNGFEPTGTHVCTINGLTPDAIADANLIAAAPDLLRALTYWVEAAKYDLKYAAWLGKARAAIAKAESGNQ